MRRKTALVAGTLIVAVGFTLIAVNAISDAPGSTMREKYGPRSRTFVLRGTITDKGTRPINSVSDAEFSEHAEERRQLENQMREDRWMAFFDVDVQRWVEGRGTHGNGPKSIVLTHGVAFNNEGERVGSGLSGDWRDRSLYDKLVVGKEFEFHVVTESFYGKYYGIVYAYPIVNGVVQEESLEGLRLRDYRFEDYEGRGAESDE
jgi:hypothetical protein